MKKLVLTIALACTLFMYSCIGSFGLTNKCYDWNNSIGDKWINELVFLALNIVPVYEITIFVDAVVLNSIEFWTGNNPVALKTDIINTENGIYLVESNNNGYTITKDEETVQLFNKNGIWYLNQNDHIVELFEYVDNDHICLNLGETSRVIELSQESVDNLRAELAE